ncbi:hypothetical protein Sta7437_2727 [Stanieria cyanosphaera PCC 7437]|uniref:DUF7305 domain-containing protein n=1 Tax=Stanieria cyanosphaera (strain ATCC 29371 / PCC 7437) TaxID=111780 RepID=K9XX49_STAC7|nr:hypothetical protein [Stanieria cyanosphaera]AFZ36252.1 hypothetical protein Sta7437_2727 [Stanieria cyanosphaera PCC 7437]
MNLLFKTLVLRQSKHQGFVIPAVIALGLIMTLVGTISIFQSSDEQITAVSQRATSKALAAAELGVARYRELIDKYKVIAVYNACNGTWTDENCSDTAGISWKQAANIPNITASCPTDGDTTVAAMATRGWQYVDANGNNNVDFNEYQYRLISYTYTSNYSGGAYTAQPFGTLIVEGRVNQSNTSLINDALAAVTQIRVDLPIQPGIPTPNGEIVQLEGNFNRFNPALWITGTPGGTVDASVTDVSKLTVNGNIILTDANCASTNTIPTTANLQDWATNKEKSVNLTPLQPQYKPLPGVVNNISSNLDSDITLPRPGDNPETRPDGSVYYNYVINGNIDLDGEDINIVAGSKVLLYVNGNITLRGQPDPDGTGPQERNADLNVRSGNNNKSYNLEIYGTAATTSIRFEGNDPINIAALIHAPNATVTIPSGNNPTVTIKGAVWVKDWDGDFGLTTAVNISPDDPTDKALVSAQYYSYTYIKDDLVSANARVVDPIIDIPSRWETQQVN